MGEYKVNFIIMLKKGPEGCNRYNGYVAFDKTCPWYKDYTDSETGYGYDFAWIECNGGITCVQNLKKDDLEQFEIIDGDMDKLGDDVLVIGFDTLHAWDRDWMWPKERVAIEVERIRHQLIDSEPKDYEEQTNE